MNDDELFSTRNAFFAGDYGSVIRALEGKLGGGEEEAIYLFVRSKLALGLGSDVLQILDSAASPVSEALRLFALTTQSSKSIPGKAVSEKAKAISQKSQEGRVLAPLGLALLRVGELEEAFKILALHRGDNLECLSLLTLIYLMLEKEERAKKELSKMQALDEESFLTFLTEAMVKLYGSGDSSSQANASIVHLYEDIAEYHDLTVPILVGQAICHLIGNKYSDAERFAGEAFTKSGNRDPDALATLVLAQSKLASLTKVAKYKEYLGNYEKLKLSFPNHSFVKDCLAKESEFSTLAQSYLQSK